MKYSQRRRVQKGSLFALTLVGIGALMLTNSCNQKIPLGSSAAVTIPTEAPPNTQASYTWLKQNVLKASCLPCHTPGSGSSAQAFPFNTYQNVMQTGDVRPGNAMTSKLFTRILENRMPPLSHPNIPRVSHAHMMALGVWINQGAKNN